MNKFYAVTIAATAFVIILTGCKSTDSASNNSNVAASPSLQPQAALSIADVEALAHAKVSDDVIISQIQNTRSVYHLAAADIINLRDTGVSDRVVNYMINTGGMSAPAAVQASALPPPAPSDTATASASPGNGYAWVAGEWQWNGATWVWAGGQWVHPPWVGAVWVPGYWYRGPFGGWRHVRGHWR
jgi:hypothetical protein